MIFFAPVIPLRAASPAKSADWTSGVPSGLRNAIHRTLGSNPWTESQEVTEPDPAFDPEFGYAVALHGTTAMVGAQQAKIDGHDAVGAVYVFQQIAGVWTRTQKLVASDGLEFDTFGHAIVFNGTTALISAYSASVNDNYG
ncbi:MAG: FG-GAP repeat protein [Dokdonella sp.]|uniref:FG-GAP repeat protein n=1 Tax=Dokdonella sp. TaxID=2291710 RepID=UPI0032641C20